MWTKFETWSKPNSSANSHLSLTGRLPRPGGHHGLSRWYSPLPVPPSLNGGLCSAPGAGSSPLAPFPLRPMPNQLTALTIWPIGGLMPRALGRALMRPDPREPYPAWDIPLPENQATIHEAALFQSETDVRDRRFSTLAAPIRLTTLLLLGIRFVRCELQMRVTAWRALWEIRSLPIWPSLPPALAFPHLLPPRPPRRPLPKLTTPSSANWKFGLGRPVAAPPLMNSAGGSFRLQPPLPASD